MINDAKQPISTPKFGFLLDELHRQGFIVGVGDMLKVHRYFTSLWEYPVSAPLPITDLKAQLAALVCQNPQQQKLFYAWFDKWASIIERRTENLIAQLEPLETDQTATKEKPIDVVEKPVEPPPPPPSTPEIKATKNNNFIPAPSLKKRKGPINIQLAFPRNPIRFWNLSEFDAVLPVLREKKWVESTEWDVKTSIKQTIKSGGVPKFTLKQKRQTPQYLMLIEQQSMRDHLAAFYADLAEELSSRDLNVAFYYYDITPALCWRERNNPKTHVPLEQLQGEYADARLFIVGHPETLLKSAQLEPSAVAMSIWETWKETAVLNPRSTGDWGRVELAIGQLFPVIPANGLGFHSLTAQWQGTEHFTPTYWQINSPEPRTPNVSEFIVSEREKGETSLRGTKQEGGLLLPSWKTVTSEDENQLNLLYFYLRDGGYRWLCAAALYPEIYYELTRLYADEVIAKNQNLSEWEQNRLWGESLRLLVRLDWFRKGNIPTHWRGLLRDDFSMERAMALNNPQFTESVKEVRRQLLEVLKLPANTEGVPEDSYAAANQAFTQVWIESEMANNLAEIPQKMTELDISMSDIEDAVGQQLWFLEGQKMEATTPKRAKTLYAVIVGIDNYAMTSLRLQGCINDANAMNQYLAAFCGANDIVYNNKMLFDEYAKRLDIIDSFTHFNQAQDGDACIFYFAGQGAQIPAPLEFWDEPDGLTETLICYDSRTEYQTGRDLADKELAYLIYKATQNKNVHFLSIVDACHSGEENTQTKKKSNVRVDVGIKAEEYLGFEEYINYQPPPANYIHFGAAQSHETTKEVKIDGATRGVFTFALVKILEETKGQISYKDLFSRVKAEVKNRAEEQTPTLSAPTLSFDMLFLGIKPKETNQNAESDPLSKKTKKGTILINIPEKMALNQETNCVIRIGYGEALLKKEGFENATMMTDIELDDEMTVELFDGSNTPTFEVEGESQRQQTIPKEGFVEWVFEVQPLQENRHVLTLKIRGDNKIEGQKVTPDILTERLIEVIKVEDGKRAVVNVETLNVYEDTSIESRIVNRRSMGDVVFVSEIRENWGLIGENQWVDIQNLGIKVKPLDAEALKTLIADGKIDTALNNFKNWGYTEGLDDDLINTIVILQGEYTYLKREEEKGLISLPKRNLQHSRMANRLLSLIDDNLGEKIIPFSNSLSNPYERSTAYLFIDLPNEMAVQAEVECRVCIGFDKDALLAKDSLVYDKQIEEIEIANFMSVELMTTTSGRTDRAQALKKTQKKVEPLKFEITPLTAKEQFIDRTDITEWVFKCTATAEGKHVLILDIQGGDGQNSYKQIASFDRRIDVQNRNKQYKTSA